jgi:hypothetical protein
MIFPKLKEINLCLRGQSNHDGYFTAYHPDEVKYFHASYIRTVRLGFHHLPLHIYNVTSLFSV